ncbi:MAG: RagB/SusD family nutrient uptake outer membrane protein [Candidatus Symbiothrix sp.]|jgi:hypothetical protein|nr:RagB/SusD family nutrient uptake outer membrane protein [Candidatus Symbiothrix sp.]
MMVMILTSIGCTETSEGFLDSKQETQTLKAIFSDSTLTMQFHAAIYWKVAAVLFAPQKPTWFLQNFYCFNSATDDGRSTNVDRSYFPQAFSKADFTQGEEGVNAGYMHFLYYWVEMYSCIRCCNQFLENIPFTPLSEISQARKDLLIAETRFLRAFYYFNLLRNWGGVPLVGDRMLDPFVDHGIPRSTFEETLQYIADELNIVKDQLPEVQDGSEYGRVTKGAALGLLTKLYFFAASPLYNGGNTGTGNKRLLTGYDDYQISRWETAKAALDSFFLYNEQTQLYELVVNEDKPGLGFYEATTVRYHNEKIWFWMNHAINGWPGKQLLPVSRGGEGSKARIVPYHDLTEAFPTKDGVEIRGEKDAEGYYKTSPGKYNPENTLFDEKNPYKNRDPRFYYTIIYNGCPWKKIASDSEPYPPVYTYRGAPQDGIFGQTGTPTGYAYAKLCPTGQLGSYSSGAGMAFLRYADVLLMYAEVLTELDINANRTQIEELLFLIRHRAGILSGTNDRYGIPKDMDKQDMLAFIINERRIELALEAGNRYWDLKRRKLFEKLNKAWMHAAVIEKAGTNADGTPVLTDPLIQPLEQHFFDASRMYHFPIPLQEIESSHHSLVQNPGW